MGPPLLGQEREPTPTLGGPWPLAGLGAGRRAPGGASSPRLPSDPGALAFTGGQPGSWAAASQLRHVRFCNEAQVTGGEVASEGANYVGFLSANVTCKRGPRGAGKFRGRLRR